MWTSHLLRKKFFEFFENRNHVVLPGISVVPINDPTLLFTNSGMVQFKNIFLNGGAKYPRVCTIQRCIRAGGKHNDLDDVGLDNYHHTFFEMLGNWSFGDYFKEEAIKYAYEFLVEELGLDKDRLYVTVYEELDKESRLIWRKYFDDNRIISASFEDNFWEMGEYGPCGPCTEIHYDRIGNRDASSLVNKDDPDVLEIWNIVFMEYNRTKNGLEDLKIKNVDTGIGFERLLSVLMNVRSNYQIDTFQTVIRTIETLSFGCTGYKFNDSASNTDVAVRVVADHTRCIAVCLNDKVQFASEGVGYVLRRIMRRGMRYALDVLKINGGDFSKIVEAAANVLGLAIDVSPVRKEEELFMKTLKKGMVMFDKIVREKCVLKGEDVFFLYDTYGFPADLTELLAREKKINITMDGFVECKKRAQELSKKNRTGFNINFKFPKTIDFYKYETNFILGELKAIVKANEIIEEEEIIEGNEFNGEEMSLIFDKTCFYSEKGGQVGDRGRISFKDGNGDVVGFFSVEDTKNIGGYVYHRGKLDGKITKRADLVYDQELRAKTRVNHSVCHILYYFLRKEFKTSQKGSLVDENKCRFDFEGEKLTDDVIERVENNINTFIKENSKRSTLVFSREEAEKEGLDLEDDESYEDGVRVILFSGSVDQVRDVCGGTHVFSTGEIKKARIITETGIQSNTRRIVLVTNERADEADQNAKEIIKAVENGQVGTTDCLLPLIESNKIKVLNKVNGRILQKRVSEIIAKKIQDFETYIVSFKLENLNRNRIFVYKTDEIFELNKKDLQKLLTAEVTSLISKNIHGILFGKSKSLDYFIIYSEDNEKLLTALISEFGTKSFRISKNYIFGVLDTTEGLLEKILSIFNQEFNYYVLE